MSREYPDRPIAAIGVVVLKKDTVLMIQRGKPPRDGQWSIPGGKQKLGETWRATAVREVREETGVEIEVIGLVDVVDAIVREGDPLLPGVRPGPEETDPSKPVRYHYTLIDCAAEWTGGEVRAGSDAAHAEWWPLDRLGELPLWSETVRIITEAVALRDGNN
ncbi:MAG: NUDIX hydrolase [Alphaproteobacteria bacterium]|nr:NUDIX hydrolase [Alphaproteobacteria bacterium]